MKIFITFFSLFFFFSNFAYAKCTFLNGYSTQVSTFDFSSLANRDEFFNSSQIPAGTLMINGDNSLIGRASIPFFKCSANESITWRLLWPVKSGGNYGYTVDTGDSTGTVSVVLKAGAKASLIKNNFTSTSYYPLYNGTTTLTYKTSPNTNYLLNDVVDQMPFVGVLKSGNVKDNLTIPSGLFFQITTSDGLELVRFMSNGVTIKSGTCEIMNPLSQVFEFNPIHRWNGTQNLMEQIDQGAKNIAIPIEINCRNSTLKPGIILNSETGFVTSSFSGRQFLRPAGSASGIGMQVVPQSGTNEGCPGQLPISQCYQKTFTFNGNKSSSGNLLMTISGDIYAIEQWRDEFVGDYEFVVGYTLVYP